MARLQKTLSDYVIIAISHTLIIALVASLVLFLIEVFNPQPNPITLQLAMRIGEDFFDQHPDPASLPPPFTASVRLEPGYSQHRFERRLFAAITESILAVLANEPVRPHQRAQLLDALHSERRESTRRMAPFNQLTPREALVLQYLMEGAAPGVIATREYVSVETVRSKVKGVLRELGATTQLEAATLAIRAGWPERSGPLGRGAS